MASASSVTVEESKGRRLSNKVLELVEGPKTMASSASATEAALSEPLPELVEGKGEGKGEGT